jgi:hypothetical protein
LSWGGIGRQTANLSEEKEWELDVGREGGREGWGEGGTEGGTELYMYNVYREKEKWWPEQARRLR